jgi:hypothetical protein
MASWRDTQLRNSEINNLVIRQESFLLDFLDEIGNPKIFWDAPHSNLVNIITRKYQIVNDVNVADTLVIFNTLNNLSVDEIKKIIRKYLELPNLKNFYVGINRYAIVTKDVDESLPDSIGDSIDAIMMQCNKDFERITSFDEITGAFFIFAHPMDLYRLCR